jgi:lysine-specific demethylase 8
MYLDNHESLTFTQIERIERPTVEEFRRLYDEPKKPVVITGAMSDWKAMSEWNHEWFKQHYGPLNVTLTRNPRHTSRARVMRLDEYVDLILTSKDDGLYMTQSPFENIPELSEYVTRPDYCVADRFSMTNLWFGPGGTVVGLHKDNHNPFDHTNNIFTQIRGRKRVVLAAPDQDEFMYQRPLESEDHWHSQVDLDNPDFSRFPLFREAQLMETVVGPGEMLFIPANYWHYVRSLEPSISVSFWWRAYRVAEIFFQLLKAFQANQLPAFIKANIGSINMNDIKEFGGIARLAAAFQATPMPDEMRQIVRNLFNAEVRASLSVLSSV